MRFPLATSVAACVLLLLLLFWRFRVIVKTRVSCWPLRIEIEYSVPHVAQGQYLFDVQQFWSRRDAFKHMRAITKPQHQSYRALLRSVVFDQLDVRASIGSSSAARTGYLAGMSWVLAGVAWWAHEQFPIMPGRRPHFFIQADFDSSITKVNIKTVLKARIWSLAIAWLEDHLKRLTRHNRR